MRKKRITKRVFTSALAMTLALSQGVTAFAADVINPAGAEMKVNLENKYWYKVKMPAIIDLEYDADNAQYISNYELQACGQIFDKMLQFDTTDIDITDGVESLTLENYIGRANLGEKNHTYVLGANEGETTLTEDWQSVAGVARHDSHGVKKGNYTGTANYKFKLVDGTNKVDVTDPSIIDSKLAIGAGQTHPIEVMKDGVDIAADMNWSSSDNSVARVTGDGTIVIPSTAKAGDTAEISGYLPDNTQAKADISESKLIRGLKDAFGPLTVYAAEEDMRGEKVVSFTVTIVEINFDNTVTSIDAIELFPGESTKVRAIIEPETEGKVTWSATRASGLGLSKNGNYCTIKLADDIPEGDRFELIATYGDYSKKLPVIVKSHHVHTAGTPVRENEVAATCTEAGSYDEVTYCVDDNVEMSREHKQIAATGHSWGAWVDENGQQVRYCNNDKSHKDIGALTEYTATYNLDGGSATGLKTTFTKEDTFTLPTPTKDGCEFVGWKGSNGTTAQKNVTIARGTAHNVSYTAEWKSKTYQLTVNLNGGSSTTKTQTVEAGKAIKLDSYPTQSGYEFLGWRKVGDGDAVLDPYGNFTVKSGNASVEAVWGKTDNPRYLSPTGKEVYSTSNHILNYNNRWSYGVIYETDGTTPVDLSNFTVEHLKQHGTQGLPNIFSNLQADPSNYTNLVAMSISNAGNLKLCFAEPVTTTTLTIKNRTKTGGLTMSYKEVGVGLTYDLDGSITLPGYEFFGWEAVSNCEINSTVAIHEKSNPTVTVTGKNTEIRAVWLKNSGGNYYTADGVNLGSTYNYTTYILKSNYTWQNGVVKEVRGSYTYDLSRVKNFTAAGFRNGTVDPQIYKIFANLESSKSNFSNVQAIKLSNTGDLRVYYK